MDRLAEVGDEVFENGEERTSSEMSVGALSAAPQYKRDNT